ncbi:MAG: hypothetical protein ABIL91_08035 [candidate division WOR-3 bacterium]
MVKEKKVKVNLEWAKPEGDYLWAKAHKEIGDLARNYFNHKLSTQTPTVLEFLKLGKVLVLNVELPSGGSDSFFIQWCSSEDEVVIKNTRFITVRYKSTEKLVSDFFKVLIDEFLDSHDLSEILAKIKEIIDNLISELEELEKQLEPIKESIESICKNSELWVEDIEESKSLFKTYTRDD